MCIILTVSKEVIGNQYTIWQKHSCTNSPSDEISKNTTAGKKNVFIYVENVLMPRQQVTSKMITDWLPS